jgi:hypothetical protein
MQQILKGVRVYIANNKLYITMNMISLPFDKKGMNREQEFAAAGTKLNIMTPSLTPTHRTLKIEGEMAKTADADSSKVKDSSPLSSVSGGQDKNDESMKSGTEKESSAPTSKRGVEYIHLSTNKLRCDSIIGLSPINAPKRTIVDDNKMRVQKTDALSQGGKESDVTTTGANKWTTVKEKTQDMFKRGVGNTIVGEGSFISEASILYKLTCKPKITQEKLVNILNYNARTR